MSLLDDINAELAEESTAGAYELKTYLKDAELVSDEYVDSGRWTEHWTAVFRRWGTAPGRGIPRSPDEYVAVDYEVPATEGQEGSEADSEAYEVRPVRVTVTKYEKV